MPEVMISKPKDSDKLVFYVPKKDLEETIESIEFDTPEKWGGKVVLGDGQEFVLEPIPQPKLPITLRAKRAGGGD
ncbi:MAG: putative nitrogen fixation protein NifT [Candidatus Methylumidiphilus sp.]